MTSRRGRSTSRRDREGLPKIFFYILRNPLFRDLSTCKLILDIEHSAGLVPTIPGPEIKPTSRNTDHGHS